MIKVIVLIMCHILGDYVLQTRFIADSKGMNWYHMFIHCVLYCVPFFIAYGLCWQLGVIFITHMFIDPLKARYGVINYTTDQILHYLTLGVYFI